MTLARHATLAITTMLVIAASVAPSTADAAACSGRAYHVFDFFLGRWIVRDAAGKTIGRDIVTRELGGCMLVEHYADATDSGRGYGIMGVRDGLGTWHQTFMDDAGALLTFEGRRTGASMIWDGIDYGKGGAKRIHSVVFTPLRDGRVEERWRSSAGGGRRWRVVFDGFFSRR